MNYDKPDSIASLASFPSQERQNPTDSHVPAALRLAGADYVKRGKVKLQAVESPGTNFCELNSSVHCAFGIVHHPSLSLARRGGEIQVERHQCGCREGTAGRFCAHCAALLVAHYGHADVRILTEVQRERMEETNISGIRVRLGTIQKTKSPVYWAPEDPVQVATPNIAVVGDADTGNTQMTESIAIQLLRQKAGSDFGILLFAGLDDYNDARSSFVETTEARVLRLHKLPVNPFSLRGLERKPQLHTQVAMAFADALTRAYGLGALEKSMLVQSVIAAYAARGITSDPVTWDRNPPTLQDVHEAYGARPQSQRSESLAQVMESMTLLELFDGEGEHPDLFDQIRGMVILDMSGYPEGLKQFALSLVLSVLWAQIQGREKRISRELKKMILVDNADELLLGGSAALEQLLTHGREHGLGMLLAVKDLDGFRDEGFDYLKWIRTWVLHNVADLRKTDLEFLLQIDIYDSMLERLYQASRRLEKLHSLVRIGTETPVLSEDLPFYEIAEDASQSYLIGEKPDAESAPLAGMPSLDTGNLDDLVTLEEIPPIPMGILDDL